MLRIGMLLPGPRSSPLNTVSEPTATHESATVTSGWVSESSLSENEWYERDLQESTETWNQVGWFLLKSRSFELIRSQKTHH